MKLSRHAVTLGGTASPVAVSRFGRGLGKPAHVGLGGLDVAGGIPYFASFGAPGATPIHRKTAAAMGIAEAKKDGAAIVARMRAMPAGDDTPGKAFIRIDGRKIHPSESWEVKAPAESKGAWDDCKHIATTPAGEGFSPLDKGGCPLVKA